MEWFSLRAEDRFALRRIISHTFVAAMIAALGTLGSACIRHAARIAPTSGLSVKFPPRARATFMPPCSIALEFDELTSVLVYRLI